MDAKFMGEQLAEDILEIVTRHHIISEVIQERMFEELGKSKDVLKFESDKDLIIESAVEEFRKVFIKGLNEVFENCKDMDDED